MCATTISSVSPTEPQGEEATPSCPRPVENNLCRTVKVLLPLPLADAYDYRVPGDMAVAPGHFVLVPLGKR